MARKKCPDKECESPEKDSADKNSKAEINHPPSAEKNVSISFVNCDDQDITASDCMEGNNGTNNGI